MSGTSAQTAPLDWATALAEHEAEIIGEPIAHPRADIARHLTDAARWLWYAQEADRHMLCRHGVDKARASLEAAGCESLADEINEAGANVVTIPYARLDEFRIRVIALRDAFLAEQDRSVAA